MQKRAINPTSWLEAFNINQGVEVTGGQRVLYLSGQTSNDAEGAPMHAGDIVAQFKLAWSNLKAVLAEADMTPANIVRLNGRGLVDHTDYESSVNPAISSTYAVSSPRAAANLDSWAAYVGFVPARPDSPGRL